MKGYKVFNEEFWWIEDCQCEVRETYESDGDGGFKFYQYFDSIFNDYRMSPKLRIYEVVAFGDIRHEYMRERTTKIKILRELQLKDYIAIDTNYSKLYAFLKYKNTPYSWKDFVKSSYAPIRAFAAEFGNSYVRWKLINDKSCMVRAAVARFGSNIQRWLLINDQHRNGLVHDIDWYVRRVLAQFGTKEHKDILVHDEDSDVRMVIAKYGDDEHRDILVNDKSADVRAVVAQYGNDEHRKLLASDKSPHVRQYIERSLR